MTQTALKATIITDASYCHTTQAGGYGAWITMDSGTAQPLRIRKGGRLKGYLTSPTQAELLAAMTGLWYAYQAGARVLLLQTDNLEVVHTINNRPRDKNGFIITLWRDSVAEYLSDARISARHVKGHTQVQDKRSYVNRWCDEVAGKFMREGRLEREGKPRRMKKQNAVRLRETEKRAAKLILGLG